MGEERRGQVSLPYREAITNRETPLIGLVGVASGTKDTRSSRRLVWGVGGWRACALVGLVHPEGHASAG